MLTTALIVVPAAAGLVLWLLPLPRNMIASLGVLVALAEVGLWITMLIRFDFSGELEYEQQWTWFDEFGISYHVGFYPFAFWLAGLTTVVMACALIYAWWAARERPSAYFGLMLFLTGATVAVFSSQDLILFYVAFEAMLIPLYVLVGVWGGPGRLGATLTFVIYTMAGSLLMLAAIIVYGLSQETFDLVESGPSNSTWIFLGFMAAFAVKAPLFPLHGWLPLAYRESPAEVSAVLSGVISKAAVFGMLRIAIGKFPEPAQDLQWLVLTLAAVGLVYGSLLAFRAPDLRGVVAYSSLAQLGLITMGLFAFTDRGYDGAIVQAVAHGLVSTTMFLLVGSVERRALTGDVTALGGMAKGRPVLATMLMTTGIVALAVPGAVTFAGEFLILAGVFTVGWGWAVVGACAIVLAAMYVLRLISAVLHESPGPSVAPEALDLRIPELAAVVPLVLCLLALSAWPAAISDRAVSLGQRIAGKDVFISGGASDK